MKSLLKITLSVLLLFTITTAPAQDKAVSFTRLPAKAQAFVKKHFSEKEVVKVSMDTEYLFKKEYEVTLRSGSNIEFDADGAWKKVEMKGSPVPAILIPATITQYIHKSFPNTFVKGIVKNRNGYEIEISNGLDLEFTNEGKFIRIDD
ncbi:PepSY-like domain-containing protein [Sphingobacterium gobiense]|uniref:Putative beta-lactamase-inhibitor-like PepSY-like domain-containing protein n=1 Tax=Sphingobacterium gobiense TaxID=1382456 RepID=A0A2S9JV95_9SPHI|nr:PepSY-like domain-containing protein [Sphingobacterium gobiense]PRD57202.1 hypothetical protein C5749_08375 [Sphingobacterium gobiense]